MSKSLMDRICARFSLAPTRGYLLLANVNAYSVALEQSFRQDPSVDSDTRAGSERSDGLG